MIVHDNIEQGTEEWLTLRSGIPTGTDFTQLVTPTGKPSTGITSLANQLAAERLLGGNIASERFENYWMKRGKELEPRARAWYEFDSGNEIQEAGFVTRDDGSAGISPDGLRTGGGLEIKCPKASTHVAYLRYAQCPSEYIPQVQGSMWVCEATTWDFVSYHEELMPFRCTVQRDDKLIGVLAKQVKKVNELVEKILADIKEKHGDYYVH